MYPKLRIICGTGRCGTFSMYRILQAQKHVFATHESLPFPWDFDPAYLYYWTQKVLISSWNKQPIWAASSYSWVKYLGLAFRHFKDVKAVALKRPRADLVESFMRHWPEENYWSSEESEHFGDQYPELNATGPDPAWLATTFPKYDLPKEEAIGAYWDEYYDICKIWAHRLPDSMIIMPMHDALNTAGGQKRILDFFDIPEHDQELYVGVRNNAAGNPQGYLYRHIGGEDVHSSEIIFESTSLN